MKQTAPELDQLLGSSRAHVARVVLLDPAGTPVRTLPVRGGTVRASARSGDRWSASLQLAGTANVPADVTDPLAGFHGYRARIQLGAVVSEEPIYVTVCDLLVAGSGVDRSADDYSTDVDLIGLAEWVSSTAEQDYTPLPGESCQAMIRRVIGANLPPGWTMPTVLDTTNAVDVPGDYSASGRPAWWTVDDLAAIANVTVYVDAFARVVIRDPLPLTPADPPARTLTIDDDVTAYRLRIGRREGFANRYELRCSQVQATADADQLADRVGVAEQTSGPLGTATIGRVVASSTVLTGTLSQARANARAAALLAPALRAWLTVELEAVPDPRLEPDDDVTVRYMDGRTATHRISELELPLDTGPMRIAARSFDLTEAPS